VRIAGVVSPGVCEISEAKRGFEFDVKKGKGAFGATATFVGRPPARLTLKFSFWQASQFAAWDQYRPLFKYDPTKKAIQAIDIYHPSLADIDITSVVCEEIGAIVHEGSGLFTVTVKLLEYFPPPKKSAVSTPSGSQSTNPNPGATPGQQQPSAQDAQQQQIQNLLQQAQQP
jgi:hypothetical protein